MKLNWHFDVVISSNAVRTFHSFGQPPVITCKSTPWWFQLQLANINGAIFRLCVWTCIAVLARTLKLNYTKLARTFLPARTAIASSQVWPQISSNYFHAHYFHIATVLGKENLCALCTCVPVCMCVCVLACPRGYFRCVAGGNCVVSFFRCNGRCDCPYCTDEFNCYMATPPSSPNSTTLQPPTSPTNTTLRPLLDNRR